MEAPQDAPWLPPGQAATEKFPVVGETAPNMGWNRESFRLDVGVALSATRFFRSFSGGRRLEARVEGPRLTRAQGLLEDQAEFLRGRGVAL